MSRTEKFAEFFDQLKVLLWGLAILAALIFAVWWSVYSFLYAPSQKLHMRKATLDPLKLSVESKLSEIVSTSVVRLEALGGYNLDIYIKQDEFEAVPYPDRAAVVEQVGKAWGDKVEHTYLPAVRFRDMKSGRILATYSCILNKATIH